MDSINTLINIFNSGCCCNQREEFDTILKWDDIQVILDLLNSDEDLYSQFMAYSKKFQREFKKIIKIGTYLEFDNYPAEVEEYFIFIWKKLREGKKYEKDTY